MNEAEKAVAECRSGLNQALNAATKILLQTQHSAQGGFCSVHDMASRRLNPIVAEDDLAELLSAANQLADKIDAIHANQYPAKVSMSL